MRVSARSFAIRVPQTEGFSIRVAAPGANQVSIILLFVLSFQPFGSFAALGLYAMAIPFCLHRGALSGRLVTNWALVGVYHGILLAFFSGAQRYNWPIYVLYFGYGTLLVMAFGILSNRTGRLSRTEILSSINWILALDLLINVPAYFIELAQNGIGDYVTGFSGLFFSESLSMNRTNAIRAGILLVLAIANFRMQRNKLSAASTAVNVTVVFASTSMTAIASFVLAVGVIQLMRRFSWRSAAMLVGLAGLIALGDAINVKRYNTTSMFEFVRQLDSRWFPKMDIYRQYFVELAVQYPWMPFFGNGLGNFMNRFVILMNYENYSYFPFKESISDFFGSSLAKTHVIDYYGLERGMVGNSIVSTPWGTNMVMLMEWGIAGIALALALAWNFLKRLWCVDFGYGVASGRFLLAFLFLNFFWDVYLDYPEVMVPFIVAACLLIGLKRAMDMETPQIKTGRSVGSLADARAGIKH